jgi:uncharacterized protein (TIGR02246 family)
MLNARLFRSAALALAFASGLPLVAQAEPPTVQTLIDRAMIQEVMSRYELTLDSGDADGYGALFAEDGVLANGRSETKGREAIVKSVKDLSARFRAAQQPAGAPPRKVIHAYSNVVIDVQGDKATSRSNWIEVWNLKGTPEVGGGGEYSDVLVKKNGQWFFQRREIIGTISTPRTPPAGVSPATAAKPAGN